VAEYILAYDIGTTGTKALVLSSRGRLIATGARQYETLYPRPGWAEQAPEAWWKAVVQSTTHVVEKVPGIKKQLVAVGVSGQMLGCLPVDRNGVPLRNAVIHSDTRAISQWQRLSDELGAQTIYSVTGNRIAAQSTLCKIAWLRQNEKAVYRKTFKFLQSKDYITSKLTGDLGRTDYSDASHSVMFDVGKREWSVDLLGAAGIHPGKLPDVHPSATIAGYMSQSSARKLKLPSGIPVVVGGGDGACASVGAGAVAPGQAYTYLGGTGWIALTLARPFIDKKMRVFNIIGLDPETCGVFGTVQCAGSAHQWVANLLNVRSYPRLEKMIREAPIGSQGLLFLPYLMGERSPIWDPYARGLYFGLSLAHGSSDLARATLEGVCFALKSVLEVLQEATPIGEMTLIGGGTKSRVWTEMLAAVYGTKLLLPRMPGEATCYGAAIAAGVGVGLFPDYAAGAKSMSRIQQECPPDTVARKRYQTLFRFWKSLYPTLKSSYYDLHNILREGSQ